MERITETGLPTAKAPWVGRATVTQLIVVAGAFGFGVWVLISAMDLLSLKYTTLVAIPMATLDALIGIAFGTLLLKFLLAQRARHRALVQRLEIIAEMNHHIRNALDRIELSAHVTHDRQVIDGIHEATARIQWALREVLPQSDSRDDE